MGKASKSNLEVSTPPKCLIKMNCNRSTEKEDGRAIARPAVRLMVQSLLTVSGGPRMWRTASAPCGSGKENDRVKRVRKSTKQPRCQSKCSTQEARTSQRSAARLDLVEDVHHGHEDVLMTRLGGHRGRHRSVRVRALSGPRPRTHAHP